MDLDIKKSQNTESNAEETSKNEAYEISPELLQELCGENNICIHLGVGTCGSYNL